MPFRPFPARFAAVVAGGRERVVDHGSVSGAVELDLAGGNVHRLTLAGNVTALTIVGDALDAEAAAFTLEVTQDATGSRTLAWPAGAKAAGASLPTVTAAAGSRDVFTLYRDAAGAWIVGAFAQDVAAP